MSPITRETLAARIAALEAEKDISIKEAFYLKTMRLLLAEIDKPQPHHNGMMQLSNELADAKAALRRLSMYARTVAGDIQYTGDHPIAVAEKLAGRQWFGNTEQLDTAPAQFESLAGEPVSPPYKLPEHVQKELQTACLCFLLGATGNKNRDNYFYDQSTDFHVCLHQVAEGMGLVKCVGNYSWVLDKEITKQIDAIYEKYAKLMMGAAMEVEQ